jgi:prephenate dehydratase
MTRVSFQGERGAYSEDAAISFFHDKIQTISCQTFAKVLKNTEDGESDYSILPIENSLEGSVGESNDLLLSTNLNAIGEIYHQIQHCLIGKGQIGDIDTVYSHPQALGQCRQFIEEHSLKAIPSYDTAGSVKIINVDFEGWQDDREIKDMLSTIQESTSFLKILGSYPISKLD